MLITALKSRRWRSSMYSMGALDLVGVKDEVTDDEGQAGGDDGDVHRRVHAGAAPRDEGLDETRQDEAGHQADHDLHALQGSAPETGQAGIRAGEEQAVAHHDAGRTRDNDAADLDGAVQPDGQQAFAQHAFLVHEVLERPQHDAVLHQDPPGTVAQQHAKGKRVEEGTVKPVNKKKAPEPKLTPPESYILAPVRVAASIDVILDEPLPLKTVAQNQKSKTGIQNQEKNNLNYEQAGYVVFKNNTTKYDLNNRFDVIEATIDYLFKYPQQRVLLAGTASDAEFSNNSHIGMQRAETVKSYMVQKGIEADRIDVMDLKNTLPKSFVEDGQPTQRLSRTDIYLIK